MTPGQKIFCPTVARRHCSFLHSIGSNESKNAKKRTVPILTSLFENLLFWLPDYYCNLQRAHLLRNLHSIVTSVRHYFKRLFICEFRSISDTSLMRMRWILTLMSGSRTGSPRFSNFEYSCSTRGFQFLASFSSDQK